MDVMKGEVICIIGPSGSGKSTLIRCVNALNEIDSGSIKVEGQEVHDPRLDKLELRKKVGMVFQQYNLFPHRTALQNIMMAPIKVLKQNPEDVRKHAFELMKRVNLKRKGKQLSRRIVGRSAAARSDCPLIGNESESDALRRSDGRTRSRNCKRGAEYDQGSGAVRNDLHSRHP